MGICRVRKNIGGELFSLNYDRVAAVSNDPIEKKPLYHFLPGSMSYSIAAMGCNFRCEFCQNYTLSMVQGERQIDGDAIAPDAIVEAALRHGSESISYTYTEPTIFFELMIETARLAKDRGLKNVMVTNGYMSVEALDMIAPYLDAANIDLKGFSDQFYRRYCGARLDPVLETIKGMNQKGIWIELTTLLIPGLNDGMEEVKALIEFISSVDPAIPWHVSRFFPQYKLTDVSPTDPNEIFGYLDLARQMGLVFFYAGNVGSNRYADTRCPNCQAVLINRRGYFTQVEQLIDGKCGSCGYAIPGVF